MSKYKINFELQSRVRKYLEYTLKNETNADEESQVMKKLNKSLKNELVMESVGRIIKSVPFFKDNFSPKTIEKLTYLLKKINLSPEEFLSNVNNYYIIF